MKNMTEAEHSLLDHKFSLDKFNGPLDLLLTLVKKKNISIFEVDLVDLATQYLNIISEVTKNNVDIASEYLVMAADLIYIKSKLILADPEAEEEVFEDKNKLLKLLSEYEEFKNLSIKLREQELMRKEIFIKSESDTNDFIKEVDESVLDGYGTSIKLITILRKMFERTQADKLRKIKLETFNMSPSDRKKEIRTLIDNNNGNITFELIFTVPTMSHFVITLIAVLDMSRKEELFLQQIEQFDEIKITKGEMY
ncbi:MAG: segregation/condensation protein A [Mycoplasmataceae bacterium]|nr:segregation/condensation protein A [Mycoplasmataceae bacterium]